MLTFNPQYHYYTTCDVDIDNFPSRELTFDIFEQSRKYIIDNGMLCYNAYEAYVKLNRRILCIITNTCVNLYGIDSNKLQTYSKEHIDVYINPTDSQFKILQCDEIMENIVELVNNAQHDLTDNECNYDQISNLKGDVTHTNSNLLHLNWSINTYVCESDPMNLDE